MSHQALLEAGRYSSHLPGNDTIGTIESVGGALAPSLAEELAEWFTAKVIQVRAWRQDSRVCVRASGARVVAQLAQQVEKGLV